MGFNQGKIKSGLSGSGWLGLAVGGDVEMFLVIIGFIIIS
jgi:hypothetical protein